MTAKAYSYARWSSGRQRTGHSLERQLAAAKEYADDNGLDLDPHPVVDDAVSAYRGANRLVGELAAFKDRILSGEIERGSYFLIDSYDRFSREATNISIASLLEIVNAGVIVVPLSNKLKLEPGPDLGNHLMFAVMDLHRAHTESAEKGRKIKKAHDSDKERARNELRKWTPVAPSWLHVTKTGIGRNKVIKYKPIPERVKIIQEIFDLYENGVSSTVIARMLNDRKVPTHYQFWQTYNPIKLNGEPRKRVDKGHWTGDTIFTTVSDRKILGEYQPHEADDNAPRKRKPDGPPIPGFYGDPIIDEAQFLRVQAMVALRRAAPRQHSPKAFHNLFINMGKCATCHGTFSLHTNNNSDNRKRVARLRCVGAQQGSGCENRLRLPYTPFEEAFLRHVSDFEVPGGKAAPDPAEQHLADAMLKRADLDARVRVAMEKAEDHPDDARREQRYQELRREFADLEDHIKNLNRIAGQGRAKKPAKDHQSAIAGLVERMATAEGDQLFSIRASVSNSIRKIVEVIYFNADGVATVYIKDFRKAYKFRDGALIGSVDSRPAGSEHPWHGVKWVADVPPVEGWDEEAILKWAGLSLDDETKPGGTS